VILVILNIYVKERSDYMIFILGTYGVITIFNLTMMVIKNEKSLKIILEKLEENGYNIDKRYTYDVLKSIRGELSYYNILDNEYYDLHVKRFNEFIGSIMPLSDINIAFKNVQYLTGYHNTQYAYDAPIDKCLNDKIIKKLKNKKLIEEDPIKIQRISDEKNALKELENKYDSIDLNENKECFSFSKNDDLNKLYEEKEKLEELIKEKEEEKNKKKEYVLEDFL
jgi:hypothetical protein